MIRIRLRYFLEEDKVNTGVLRELRMKSSRQVPPLLYQDGIAPITSENFGVVTHAPNNGSADKDRLHVAFHTFRLQASNAAVELAPISVALHFHIHQTERRLRRVGYPRRQQDCSRARSKDGMLAAELAQRIEQLLFLEQFHHGGAFAARNYQPLHAFQIRRRPYFHGLRAGASESALVRFEIALEGKNTDSFHYQPRVCINSDSFNFAMSRPNIAVPNSSLASSSLTGSL